jgi:hypothetical protein
VSRASAKQDLALTQCSSLKLIINSYHLPSTISLQLPSTCRRVWVSDATEGFLPGWVKSQSGDSSDQEATAEVVISISGETKTVPLYALSPMNPPQFDGVEDIADLTHLNEASVINNLKMRYGAGDIYVSVVTTFRFSADEIDILWVSCVARDI